MAVNLSRKGDVWYKVNNRGSDAITLREFEVIKSTPKGVWIDHYGKRKFCLTGSGKRFAHQTKELAVESFIARKQRQIRILTAQLSNAEWALDTVIKGKAAGMHPPYPGKPRFNFNWGED